METLKNIISNITYIDILNYISKPTEARINEFKANHANWVNTPYSQLLGQTENKNHFVC